MSNNDKKLREFAAAQVDESLNRFKMAFKQGRRIVK